MLTLTQVCWSEALQASAVAFWSNIQYTIQASISLILMIVAYVSSCGCASKLVETTG